MEHCTTFIIVTTTGWHFDFCFSVLLTCGRLDHEKAVEDGPVTQYWQVEQGPTNSILWCWYQRLTATIWHDKIQSKWTSSSWDLRFQEFMKLTTCLMDEIHSSDKEIMYMESDFLPLKHKDVSCSLHSNPASDLITLYTNQSEPAQWFRYASLSAEAFCYKNLQSANTLHKLFFT